MDFFLKRMKSEVVNYTLKNLNKVNNIDFLHTLGLRNNSCHWNSADELKLNGGEIHVFLVIHKNTKTPYLHFINFQSGKYKDVTYGYSYAQQYDYFYIRKIKYYSEMNMAMQLDIEKLRIINFIFSHNKLKWWYAKQLNKTDSLI